MGNSSGGKPEVELMDCYRFAVYIKVALGLLVMFIENCPIRQSTNLGLEKSGISILVKKLRNVMWSLSVRISKKQNTSTFNFKSHVIVLLK